MHLDLTDAQALAVASTLRFTVTRLQRVAKGKKHPLDKRMWALETVESLLDVIAMLPEPPKRAKS